MGRKKQEPEIIVLKPMKVHFSQSLIIERGCGSYLRGERFPVYTREEAQQIVAGLTDALSRWVPPCE